MILTAHQPVYLPWLGLFHKIALADVFVSFDMIQYLPKDWNNRNRIKTANGTPWLTVPVLRKGYLDKPIWEIKINNTIDWRKKHWKTIEMAYSKAPYFKKHDERLLWFYEMGWTWLADLNYCLLRYFLNSFNIGVEIVYAHHCTFQGKGSDLVLDMCKKLGADTYIFGALGRNYADVEAFKKEGIEVVFQDYKHPVYNQLHGDFVPYMSAIDLLFNHGPDSLDIIMKDNIAKEDLL